MGGLYDLTNAVQGKAGSASDQPMAAAKKKLLSEDFNREVARYQIPLTFHPQHPLRTVDAGRLLCAFPVEHRPALAHKLFEAYWKDNSSIDSRATLLRIARSLRLTSIASPSHSGPFSQEPTLPFLLDESIFADVQHADALRANTEEAFQRGAFGVPSFWVNETSKLLWGQDRMVLLEAELISIKLSKPIGSIRQIERLLPRCLRTAPENRPRRMTFWYDFSSPWAYLGWYVCSLSTRTVAMLVLRSFFLFVRTQLERLQREAGDSLKIELKPFLLGALFKAIGTPMLPGLAQIPAKVQYAKQDLQDWNTYWSAVNSQEYPPIDPPNFQYCDEFPIRSVTALRVALLEPLAVAAIFKAAWSQNLRISDPKVLAEVLTAAGFNGTKLVTEVTTGSKAAQVKDILKSNTDEAVKLGICGVSSFPPRDSSFIQRVQRSVSI